MKKYYLSLSFSFITAFTTLAANGTKTLNAYKNSYAQEKSGKYNAAIKALAPIYKSRALDYTLNMRLGWLYYLSGKYNNAKEYYKKASKTSASIEAKLGYLLPLIAENNYKQVEAVTGQILKADKNNYYGNLRRAFAFRMQRKYSQAEKVASNMLKLYPSDISFLLEYSLTKLGQRDLKRAQKALIRTLHLDPTNATATELINTYFK